MTKTQGYGDQNLTIPTPYHLFNTTYHCRKHLNNSMIKYKTCKVVSLP